MSIIGAYRTAKALADMGHADSPVIPHADMTMAAILAGTAQPTTAEDRAAILADLDEIAAQER